MPLTIKKARLLHLCGNEIRPVVLRIFGTFGSGRKKRGGIPCREHIRKIFPCLLLGLIYFVKVK